MTIEVTEMGFDPGRLGLCPSDVSSSKKNVLLGCINRSTVARMREVKSCLIEFSGSAQRLTLV